MQVQSFFRAAVVVSTAAVLAALTFMPLPTSLYAAPVRIQRISVGVTGEPANDWSGVATISGDGRYVAFESAASNLIRGDTNGQKDIFVRDVQTGTTERVSVTASGVQGNGNSANAVISTSGRFVTFHSSASNLTQNDANGFSDIFVKDRQTGVLERISVSVTNVAANGYSSFASISADGRYVAFQSAATNLVPNDTNGQDDIFVKDRQTGVVERVSVSSDELPANGSSFHPTISADGRLVMFSSWATNLAPNDTWDSELFLRDLQADTTVRVGTSANGTPGNNGSGAGDFSGNSRYLAFSSHSSNLVPNDTNGLIDVLVKNRATGALELISAALSGGPANGHSGVPALNGDGRIVAFTSLATNLLSGDTNGQQDVFVRDRQTGVIERLSVSANGTQSNGLSDWPDLSDDGRFVVFESEATNLAPPFTSESYMDIFLVDRSVPITP